jgi:hypothetical protein
MGLRRVAEDYVVGGLPNKPVDNSLYNISFLDLKGFRFSMVKNKNGSHVGCHFY